MEPVRSAPDAASFVPIAEHQARTPSSFHDGPPVLHYHSQRCKVVILEQELRANTLLNALRGETATTNGTDAPQDDDEGTEIAIEGVDTWVGSEKFILYSPTASAGISIPYPSISLHAIQRLRIPGTETETQGLYMQIATPTAPSEEDIEECITLTVIPSEEPQVSDDIPSEHRTSEETESAIQKLYNAVCECSNLHPDPAEPGDEEEEGEQKLITAEDYAVMGSGDGDLPPPVDGSSGWITADNMHEFFDEEGNWIAGGEAPSFPGLNSLGPGAGTVRERGEANGDAEEDDDETKWRRTE